MSVEAAWILGVLFCIGCLFCGFGFILGMAYRNPDRNYGDAQWITVKKDDIEASPRNRRVIVTKPNKRSK